MMIWMVAAVALQIWWLFFSGLKWRFRLTGIAALFAAVAVFSMLFRFEGMTGDGFYPRPYWPSHTDQFGTYPVRAPW